MPNGNDGVDLVRRRTLKALIAVAGIALLATSLPPLIDQVIPPEVGLKEFPRLLLVDESGKPIKASQIPVNTQYILRFFYPLSNEPNMLLNLGDESGRPVEVPPTTVVVPQNGVSYEFPGGVGPSKSIVAYSGVCQHLGCEMPLMSFYPNVPTCQSAATSAGNLKGVIHCLCHGSTYDPYRGGAVVTGPTVRPLPAVVLEWDQATDELYAVKMIGPVIYGHPGFDTPTQDTVKNPTGDLQGGTPAGTTNTVVSNLGKLTQCT